MAEPRLYKKKPGHVGKTHAGFSDLESFFAWALKLCRRDETNRVMVETPDWRITWDASKKPTRKRKSERRAR